MGGGGALRSTSFSPSLETHGELEKCPADRLERVGGGQG